MKVNALQTPVFHLGDNLFEFILHALDGLSIQEGQVLVVTSKIVSLAESCIIWRAELEKDGLSKTDLVRKEADVYLGEVAYSCHLTIKHDLLIPSSGIDESNCEGDFFILFPKDPFDSARRLHEMLSAHFKVQNFGVVISDSHTTPLRRGVMGVALSFWGFKPTHSYVGAHDLFGRPLQFTYGNLADSLAASAHLLMGEADESRPLILIEDFKLEWTLEDRRSDLLIPLDEDLYAPLLKRAKTDL